MVDLLVEKIIDKKELRGVSEEFAKKEVVAWLDKYPHIKKEYEQDPEKFFKKKNFQSLRSDVREHLRRVYGVFFTNKYPAKREGYLAALIDEPSEENALEIMSIHRSTHERLEQYSSLYEQLFAVTGTPASILDIGCGYNPFSYPFLGCTPAYHSADIACDDLKHIGEFHDSLHIENSQHCVDLTTPGILKHLPKTDVVFAFKVFDSLEEKEWGKVEALLKDIKANWLVASFPTLSIGQKKTISPREWFERLVTDKVEGRVTLANEQFIIITLQRK